MVLGVNLTLPLPSTEHLSCPQNDNLPFFILCSIVFHFIPFFSKIQPKNAIFE